MSIEEFQYDLRKRDEMSGNQLIISNFRSWRNDNYFDLKSINLLLGSNSSGKSSIIHALSFLKQSKLSWSLIPKSDEIDLGRVEDQVNYKTKSMRRRNKDDYIGFGLKYQIKPDDLNQNQFMTGMTGQRYKKGNREEKNRINSNDFSRLIGNLEYIERYDDKGLIKDIILSSRKRKILTVSVKNKKSSKQVQVSVEVTNDPLYWEEFIDLSGKTEIRNRLTISKGKIAKKELDKYEQDLKKFKTKEKKLTKKEKTPSLTSKELESVRVSLSEIKSKISFTQFSISHLKPQIDNKEIPGDDIKKKCNYISENLSTKFTIDEKKLQKNGLVIFIIRELLNKSDLLRKHMLMIDEKQDDNEFDLIAEMLSTLNANAKSDLNIHPFLMLSIVYSRFKKITSSVIRIGPHRKRPDRVTFVNPNDKNTFVGIKGENVKSVMHQITESQKKELNNWFDQMEIPYKIDVKFYPDFNISKIVLTDHDGMDVSLTDVGYGIGQVLPIILTSMLQENTLITIEQPELHLHPKLQANLADLFIRSASIRNNNFILETHSEHIILRLKRRQKEVKEKVSFDNSKRNSNKNTIAEWISIRDSVVISVVNTPKNKSESEYSKITLNSDGDFDTLWPGDFFPERYIEMGLGDDF